MCHPSNFKHKNKGKVNTNIKQNTTYMHIKQSLCNGKWSIYNKDEAGQFCLNHNINTPESEINTQ